MLVSQEKSPLDSKAVVAAVNNNNSEAPRIYNWIQRGSHKKKVILSTTQATCQKLNYHQLALNKTNRTK